MIRETSVKSIEKILRLIPEDFLCEKISHTVGEVKDYLQIRIIPLILEHKVDIVLMYVHRMYASPLCCRRSRTSLLYPFLNLSQASVQAHRQRLASGDFHSVVFGGIV